MTKISFRAAPLIVIFTLGCGGSAKPAVTDSSGPASDAPATSESSDSRESSAPSKSDETKSAESSGDEATSDDRKAVLQLVIDDEELGKYLRVTEPGRFPLKVSGSDIPSGLTKATKPIVIVDSTAPKAAVLVITEVQIGAKKASVSYRYDIEGIKGTTTLDKGPRGWEILRSRIVEHFRPDSDK